MVTKIVLTSGKSGNSNTMEKNGKSSQKIMFIRRILRWTALQIFTVQIISVLKLKNYHIHLMTMK